MLWKRFERLARRELLKADEIEEVIRESEASGRYPEDMLVERGIPKHEVLFSLAEYCKCAFLEYDEGIIISRAVTRGLDMERLKKALWVPLATAKNRAEIIAYRPDDPAVVEDIRGTLMVDEIIFSIAMPSDIVRIIENNQDLNPGFSPAAGRTPLAKVRTFLADRRSSLSCSRTHFAKGRTGLAFIRTGISFMATALVLLRIFGIGYLIVPEAILFVAGAIIGVDGLLWYIPARKAGSRRLKCGSRKPDGESTVLQVINPGDEPVFSRTAPVPGAESLRSKWNSLSPVMRRRFLANDRTDLAEERTTLSCYRTLMARARTGLAFTRTGVAFVGIGIALLRQFHPGPWTVLDGVLMALGLGMAAEGFFWYFPGRRAGAKGLASVKKMSDQESIWDFVLATARNKPVSGDTNSLHLLKEACSPGIWATTGLALERTVLAERRNVMARLRTMMSRSRTGMAFIRTGMSISAIGAGLLVYFGIGNAVWTVFNCLMLLAGFVLIADGLSWHLPAERIRSQFPYCYGDMEITVPDYGSPTCTWGKAVFTHDEL